MAEYQGTVLTPKGLALFGKVQAGRELHFTKVMYGAGTLLAGQSYRDITTMIEPKMELAVRSVQAIGTGEARLEAILSNTGLVEGFFAREMGVYATDPDEGEILYAYDYAGDKSDWIAKDNGSNPLNVPVDVYFVVGQAMNLVVNVVSGLYALEDDFQKHVSSQDIHLKIGSVVTDCDRVLVQQSNGITISPISFDTFKTKILGGDGADISIMRGRIDQAEREMANIALRLEAEGIYPDYNTLLAEDFKIPDLVDQFSCDITSIVAGDDSIDVSTLRGIVPGAWYTISDGVGQERCQVKSVVKNGSTYRLIMMAAITNTYVSGQVTMYRTTAQIQSSAGQAEGSGDRRSAVWQPATVFTGTNANTSTTLALVTTASNSAAFTTSGDIGYTADGAVTLV